MNNPFLVFCGVILAGCIWVYVSANFILWLGKDDRHNFLLALPIILPMLAFNYFLPFKTWWGKLLAFCAVAPAQLFYAMTFLAFGVFFHPCQKGVIYKGDCGGMMRIEAATLAMDAVEFDENGNEKKNP